MSTDTHKMDAGNAPRVTKGTRFNTHFEKGCEVITEPDEFGNFNAFDSEGVICQFSVAMIVATDTPRKNDPNLNWAMYHPEKANPSGCAQGG